MIVIVHRSVCRTLSLTIDGSATGAANVEAGDFNPFRMPGW